MSDEKQENKIDLTHSSSIFLDPNPEKITRPSTIKPLTYKQNVQIRFLKAPEIPLGPLIVRQIRAEGPPPPAPLIVRQIPVRSETPPPIILREKPPSIPPLDESHIVTRILPPLEASPRSVIIEKFPALPTKPADIIIERWIPYQYQTTLRKVIVQPIEENILPPSLPKNLIIEYEPVQVKIVHKIQRSKTNIEDPQLYREKHGETLLDTDDLLQRVKDLGIEEDLVRFPEFSLNNDDPQDTK